VLVGTVLAGSGSATQLTGASILFDGVLAPERIENAASSATAFRTVLAIHAPPKVHPALSLPLLL